MVVVLNDLYSLLSPPKDMSDELWNEFETFEKSCGEVDANSTMYCIILFAVAVFA